MQETVDRNLAERAARQKLTDEIIAKRKQTAALEAKLRAAVEVDSVVGPAALEAERAITEKRDIAADPSLEAEQKAEHHNGQIALGGVWAEAVQAADSCTDDEIKKVMTAIFDFSKKLDARELREIEMHNAQIDAMQDQINAIKNITEVLETLCNIVNDISDSSKTICRLAIPASELLIEIGERFRSSS